MQEGTTNMDLEIMKNIKQNKNNWKAAKNSRHLYYCVIFLYVSYSNHI